MSSVPSTVFGASMGRPGRRCHLLLIADNRRAAIFCEQRLALDDARADCDEKIIRIGEIVQRFVVGVLSAKLFPKTW